MESFQRSSNFGLPISGTFPVLTFPRLSSAPRSTLFCSPAGRQYLWLPFSLSAPDTGSELGRVHTSWSGKLLSPLSFPGLVYPQAHLVDQLLAALTDVIANPLDFGSKKENF